MRNMKITKLAATLGGAVMLAAGLGATTAATAAPASARPVKVIQNCGRFLACASYRPSRFNPGHGLAINHVHWRTYNTRRAVGWGHFGKRYICNARFAEGDTCVKITLTSPVTDRAGDHYFNHLLFQPMTMGGYSTWSWRTATYNGRF